MGRPRKVKTVGTEAKQIRRVVGYCRVSTLMQVDDGYSLDDQRRQIEAAAITGGYELLGIYEAAGVSGKGMDQRPQLTALLKACARGEVEAVITCKLDRLTRSLADLLTLSDQLERAGVALVSLKESLDTGTSTGRLFRNILGALAEFERDTISDRVTAGMAEKARQGHRVGARAPYGYALEAAAVREAEASGRRKRGIPLPRTVIVEEQTAVVRRIFAERSAGATIAAIAEGLNADGIPGPNGGRWVVSRVYAILTNPYYAGHVRFNERRARATIVAAAADHPAIIDMETCQRASGAAAA